MNMMKRRFKKRFKKRGSIFRSQFLRITVLSITVILTLFHFFLLSGIFELKNIKVISQIAAPEKDLLGILEKGLSKRFFQWFSAKPLILVRLNRIENEILAKYPQAKTVHLKKDFPHTLILEIEKRKPMGTWCNIEENVCFLFDKTGVIFEEKPRGIFEEVEKDKTNPDLILLLSEKTEETKKIGDEILTSNIFSHILEIDKILKETDLEIESFLLASLPSNELTVKLNEGWKIYFDLATDIKLALTKLDLLLKKEIPQEERRNLEYIDLRFSKAYYR